MNAWLRKAPQTQKGDPTDDTGERRECSKQRKGEQNREGRATPRGQDQLSKVEARGPERCSISANAGEATHALPNHRGQAVTRVTQRNSRQRATQWGKAQQEQQAV